MRMTINELDKDSLKELRGKLLEMKKAQVRMEKEQMRLRMDEEYRILYGLQREAEQKPGREREL